MSNAKKLELVRALGPWTSAAIVVGTMIGTGIFLKPAEMAADAGSVVIVFAAWIAGGILSLFGALAFAELGAAIPEAGGEYAYLRRGFGPVWGFLFGWMHSVVGRPASMASIAAGLLRFADSWRLRSPRLFLRGTFQCRCFMSLTFSFSHGRSLSPWSRSWR